MSREPTSDDYLLELFHQWLESEPTAALHQWRRQIGQALEAWNHQLAERLMRELARHAQDSRVRAYRHLGRAGLLTQQDEREMALVEVTTAVSLFRQTADKVGHCWALITQGNLYSDQAAGAEALCAYEQAVMLYQEQEDIYGEAQGLANLGTLYYQQSQWGQALQAYRQALNIFLDVGDIQSAALCLNGLGDILTDLGNYEEAIECYEACLEIFSEAGDISGQTAVLNNLGRAWDSADSPHKALDCYHHSLELAQQRGDFRSQAIALDNLGVVLQTLGRLLESLEAHQQSLAIYRHIEDLFNASASLNHLGMVYRQLNDFVLAEQAFREAVALKERYADKRGLASVWLNFVLLRISQGQWPEVEALAKQALVVAQELRLDQPLATAHLYLGLAATEQQVDAATISAYFTTALTTAWTFHAAFGQKINRSLVNHLMAMIDAGHGYLVVAIIEALIAVCQEELVEQPEAVANFYPLLSKARQG